MALKEVKCPHCHLENYVNKVLLNPYKYRYFQLICIHCGEQSEIDNLNSFDVIYENRGDFYE